MNRFMEATTESMKSMDKHNLYSFGFVEFNRTETSLVSRNLGATSLRVLYNQRSQ